MMQLDRAGREANLASSGHLRYSACLSNKDRTLEVELRSVSGLSQHNQESSAFFHVSLWVLPASAPPYWVKRRTAAREAAGGCILFDLPLDGGGLQV